MTPAFPKRGPDAGTMDQVRPHCAAWHQTTLTVDWPTYPLQTPSGGGLAPTPDRSKTPAKGFLASGEEGLTNQGPLQKGAISVAHCAFCTGMAQCAEFIIGPAQSRTPRAFSPPRLPPTPPP